MDPLSFLNLNLNVYDGRLPAYLYAWRQSVCLHNHSPQVTTQYSFHFMDIRKINHACFIIFFFDMVSTILADVSLMFANKG